MVVMSIAVIFLAPALVCVAFFYDRGIAAAVKRLIFASPLFFSSPLRSSSPRQARLGAGR